MNWGRVPKDKAICSSATSKEAQCITTVREWVQKNTDSIFSKVLSEESLKDSLLPLGHIPFDDRVTVARPRVVPARKRPLDPSPSDKGKKPCPEGT